MFDWCSQHPQGSWFTADALQHLWVKTCLILPDPIWPVLLTSWRWNTIDEMSVKIFKVFLRNFTKKNTHRLFPSILYFPLEKTKQHLYCILDRLLLVACKQLESFPQRLNICLFPFHMLQWLSINYVIILGEHMCSAF